MKWQEAQDAEGFPARRAALGSYNAFLIAEQKQSRLNWCALIIVSGGNEYVFDYYADRVYENWNIEGRTLEDAEANVTPFVREFIERKKAEMLEEIRTMEAAVS